MKKFFTFLSAAVLCVITAFSLAACGSAATPPTGGWQNPDDDTDRPVSGEANILVTYFSVPDNVSNSYVEIGGEQLGNTQYMAYVIQETTGANIFRILPEGEFHFPNGRAAEIAVRAVKEYKRQTDSKIKVIFNVFKECDYAIYARLLGKDC